MAAGAAATGAALRLLLLYRFVRVAELIALAFLLSWSSSRLHSAAAALLRLAASLLLDPRFVFLLGNAIVLLLLALFRRDLSLSHNHHQNHAHPLSFAATPSPPPAAEAPRPPVEFEDKQAVHVWARAPQRSKSEKMARGRRAASPPPEQLKRSESENGRRRKSSAVARDAEEFWGVEDADEFRRTVEAFIAKEITRFHHEESMTMSVVVAGAATAEVSPAIAGTVAVVE